MPSTETPEPVKTQPAASFRPFRWLLFLVLLLVAAPSILTLSGQTMSVVRMISPRLAQAINFETSTIHWWTPVTINRLTITDLAVDSDSSGVRPSLATIGRLSTTKPLWRIAMALGRGLEVTAQDPVVNLRVSDGQTNVERTLQQLSGPAADDGRSSFPMVLNVNNGTVRLMPNQALPIGEDTDYTTIHGINARVSSLDTAATPQVSLVANIGTAQTTDIAARLQNPGGLNPRIAAKLDELSADFPLQPFSEAQMNELTTATTEPSVSVQIVPSESDSETRQISIEARRLNLQQLDPLLERYLPGLACSGQVSCRFQGRMIGRNGMDGMAGRVQLLGEHLHIRDVNWVAGESLNFETLTVQGAGAVAEDGVLLKHLHIQSALIDANGNGEVRLASPSTADSNAAADSTPTDQVRLDGRLDLAALSTMLPQTLKIDPSVRIRSADLKFSARIDEERPDAPQRQLLISPKGFRWQVAVESSPIDAQKDNRAIKLDSSLRLDAMGAVAVDHISVQEARIAGNFGQLNAHPVEGSYNISGTLNPDRLWNDLRQIIDLPHPGLDGVVSVTGQLAPLPDGVRIADLKLSSSSLTADSPALTIHMDRPALDMLQGQMTVRGFGRAIKTVAAPWHDATWLADDSSVAIKLLAEPTKLMELTVAVTPTQTSRRANRTETFQLREGRLEASVGMDTLHNGFAIEHGQLQLPGLNATLTGTLTTVDSVLLSDLAVDVQYNLDSLTAQLLNASQQNLRLNGEGRESFQVTGAPGLWTVAEVTRHRNRSAAPADVLDRITPLSITGKISWDGGDVYGLPLGPGIVIAELRDGVLRTEPVQCSLGTGQINVLPQWDMNSNLLQLASGSRIEKLQITPELAKEWLGYVAPLMGASTNVSGAVSCRVVQFDHFLDRPQQSNIQAVLTIHNASAAPGASLLPLLQVVELVSKRSVASNQLEFRAQEVPFAMRDGLITHQGLQFGIADYEMVSSGGVGVDRRIQLSLDVPVERSSLDSRGRTIRLAVGGTVDQPQIDTGRLLQNIGQQQIQKQLGNQLDRGLNKLFDKLR